MRLPLLALALSLAGCGVFDCPSAGPYGPAEGTQRLVASPAASDTLTVVVEADGYVPFVRDVLVSLDAVTPYQATASGETELFTTLEFLTYEPDEAAVPRLATEARADTFVVRLDESAFASAAPRCARAEGVVQPVCSYAEPELTITFRAVRAPEGVRHVEYLRRDPYRGLVPLASGPAAPRATGPRPRRTALG